MFGGYNSNMMLPYMLEDNQFHYDSSAPTQLQLFGNSECEISEQLIPLIYIITHHSSTLIKCNYHLLLVHTRVQLVCLFMW